MLTGSTSICMIGLTITMSMTSLFAFCCCSNFSSTSDWIIDIRDCFFSITDAVSFSELSLLLFIFSGSLVNFILFSGAVAFIGNALRTT